MRASVTWGPVVALLIALTVLLTVEGIPYRKPYRSPPRRPLLKPKSPLRPIVKVPPPPGKFHHLLPPADLLHYFGTENKHEVPEYTITSPRHVSGSRHRRDVDSKKDRLEYHVTAFGKTYELILDHNNNLVAPGCVMERVVNKTKQVVPCYVTSSSTQPADSDCFYTGYSKSHSNSTVAVSLCTGLHGIISIPEDGHDFVMKPIKGRHTDRARRSSSGDNLHIVFKRAAKNQLCESVLDTESSLLQEIKKSVHSAKKRSTDELYLELLLVADKTMYQYHGSDLQNFLLAVTNVAAARFVDPSLGRTIHLTVVKIKILEDDQPGLEVVDDARYGLKSFCEWQEKENPALDTDPLHYDAAVLFTRIDLQHGASGHSTVGLANAGGVCTASSRCAYVEDTGVDTGLTFAHELGHNLGLSHDGSQNTCSDSKNLMATAGATGPESFKWSTCSRDALNTFLSSGRGECLKDVPTHHEELPKDLPGVIYDADDQCRLWVGTKYYNHTDPCGQLWCVDPANADGIVKSGSAMMDGSMCGQRKYCIKGECVDIGADGPQPIDGGWSAWPTQWSECSRTCGGGIRTKVRNCDNPKPRFGGKPCEGESTKTNLCNVKSCNSSEAKFKESQCQATKDQPVDGQLFDWTPWEQSAEQCYLMCKTKPGDRIFRRTLEGSKNFIDGTYCVGDHRMDFFRCVRGACQAHSCDGHSDSKYTFDKCGVCGGSNDTCTAKKGAKTLGEPQTISVNGKPIINENPSMPSASQTYSSDGVTFNYQRGDSSQEESIDVIGPLTADIEAQVRNDACGPSTQVTCVTWDVSPVYGPLTPVTCVTWDVSPVYGTIAFHGVYLAIGVLNMVFTFFADQRFQPNVSYEYSVPISDVRPYQWMTSNTRCNAECGGGNYEVDIKCYKVSDNSVVEDKFCNIFDKPDTVGGMCNPQPCQPEWRVGEWGGCSKSCGSGTQIRAVDCVQKSNGGFAIVGADQCPADKRPVDNRVCNVVACDAKWATSAWSSCSMTCGRGVQTRQVRCMSGQSEVSDANCKEPKPESRQACVERVCDTNIAADQCKDAITDCGGYDLTMCNEYGDWAKANCKVTCSFCSPSTSVPTVSECEDKSKDCTSYGTSVCSGEYAQWAGENCAKFCGKCTSAIATAVVSSTECSDKSIDCTGYGVTVCTGEYADWAAENCAKFCGKCTSATVVSSSECSDKSTDCTGYGLTVCSGEYADWAAENCAKFCGKCTSDVATTASPISACADKSSDCAGYGLTVCTGEYAQWATENCASYCGLCGGTTTVQTVVDDSCSNANPDCSGYGASICQGEYADWSKVNCAKLCGQCSSSAATSQSQVQTCEDISKDCAGYGPSVCTGEYADWAKVNCANYCHNCGTGSSASSDVSNCVDKISDCADYGKEVCTNEYSDWAKENCQKIIDLQHGASGHSTVGLANAGGVCTASSRCAYVEDTGVDTGLTFAHELGHNLGLSHDGSLNTCSDSKNLMATAGATGPESFKWSTCSRDALNTFLSSGRGECLKDVPTHHEELPKDLPGVIYDADDQCRLWVGTKYYNHTDPCGQLWCVDPANADGIVKSGSAMMDGSMCGQRKYCIKGECVDIGADGPQPIDGGWSAWPTQWSECSRTCGGGIRTKVRNCDNPKPRFGGKSCEGESTKTNLCNVKSCNSSEAKFKESQCQATKDQPVDGQLFDWTTWEQSAEQCYLMCKTKPGDRIFRRTLEGSKNFIDGTYCVGDHRMDFFRCVRGACQAHSCDGHSDSKYTFDKCGVCGGSNDTCTAKRAQRP
ncbi:hypothetical protein Btru_051379 [Bulinus truncatus]|nr:hypothetical protein Btru_051379 [Bulinus truncatus]